MTKNISNNNKKRTYCLSPGREKWHFVAAILLFIKIKQHFIYHSELNAIIGDILAAARAQAEEVERASLIDFICKNISWNKLLVIEIDSV